MAVLVAVAAALAPDVRGADPVPAPLSTAPVAPASSAPDAAARGLPAAVTICRAPASTRCWVRRGDDPCVPDGEPFRVVPDRPGEVASALAACRTPGDAPAAGIPP